MRVHATLSLTLRTLSVLFEDYHRSLNMAASYYTLQYKIIERALLWNELLSSFGA